jgi:Domain of unknown function (DUF5664)
MPVELSPHSITLADNTIPELVAKNRTLAAELFETQRDRFRAETARDELGRERDQALRERDDARAVSACDELERDEWKETADTYLRQRDQARADARKHIARADSEREEAQKRAAKLEAQTPSAYHGAVESLRVERDEARAEVLRLQSHLSPPNAHNPVRSHQVWETRRSYLPKIDVKPRPDLIPAEALLDAGACLADRSDRDVGALPWFDTAPLEETLPKYRASLSRHVLAYYADEGNDPQSGRPHLAHALVNAAILYRLENRAALAARENANNPKES